ncbi:MAG TPA: MMPL family transporter, partial [Candidatus Acidoferrum sp.]|nr:MMPL family transporter [Candidatus Acidoferrum sp.]
MPSAWETIAPRLLDRLASALIRYPRWFLFPQILLAIFCIYYTVANLEFDASRDNLVGGDKKYHQNFLKFKKEFSLPDELVCVVESEDREKNRQFVERLGAKLELETNLFMDVVWKGDFNLLGPKALLFVPEDQLVELKTTLRDFRPFLQQFTHATNLSSLFGLVNRQFLTASREENAETTAMIKALPALERILAQASDSLERQGTPPSPGLTALFGGDAQAESEMYITFADARIYLVTVRALKDELNEKAVPRLRELVAETQLEVPGLNVGVTGEPVLELDEMEQSRRDTEKATIISLAIVAVIFIYGYHETGRPIKATLSLIVGLAYTMAFTTAVIGHLNILTVTFAPILVGIAIDFGVHLITRYEEEIRRGLSNEAALRKAMVYTGMGIITGALTTAGAFLAMAATDFRGIQEMGIICGGGLAICLIPMMTLLPVMLLRGRQNVIDHAMGKALERRAKVENLWLTRPRLVIAVVLGTCAAAGFAALPHGQRPGVYFDYNLLNMQSEGLPAVVFGKKLITSAHKSVLYGAIIADSLDDALKLEAKLTNLASVASVDLAGIDGMARYLTEDQSKKLAIVSEIKGETATIRFAPLDLAPVNINDFRVTLFALSGYSQLAPREIPTNEIALRAAFTNLHNVIFTLSRQLLMSPSNEVSTKLAAFQQALFRDIRDTFETIRTQDDRGRLTIDDLPQTIRGRFLGSSGKYLVQVYPKKDVWQRAAQKEFVAELQSVAPNATGTPVQLYFYTSLLKSSYQQAALYALIAIIILVWLHFRQFSCVVLALTPVTVGALWMVGIMGVFDVPFNPANIMTLPLIIGIGVTNGIHILNRFAEEQNPSVLARSTGKAVIVSGL